MTEADTLNNVLNSVISASPLLVTLAPFGAALKVWITKDMITKDDCENYIDRLRRDIMKELDEDRTYLQTLDKRTQDTAKEVSEIRGELKAFGK